MRRWPAVILLAVLAALAAAAPSRAQPVGRTYPTLGGGPALGSALLCQDTGGLMEPCSSGVPLQIAGTFSATLAGFQPALVGAPITATTGGVTGTLPASQPDVVVQNVGSTNGAYCQLGSSATGITGAQYLPSGGGWWAYHVGAATQITCEGSGGTTQVNLIGGAGLITGSGGGGGGGGSGGNVNLNQVGGTSYALGAAVSASSMPVVIASDQAAVAVKLNATPSLANGNGTVPTQGGSVLSATNGSYTNLLQGNLVLSTGNPLFASITNTPTVEPGNTPNTTPWLFSPSTGGNTAAVKAASTAAGATDPALVVAISPNNTPVLPTGAATAANQTAVQATVGAGTAPADMNVAGCVYNSTPLTVSNTQSAAQQCDANGFMKVNIAAGGTIAAASTTSGQGGSLIFGAAATTPPSETTAQSYPVSLDLNGGLRTAPQCNKVISVTQTATTDVHTFTGFGYICSVVLVSATAQNIGVDEGTGTTCETSGTALIGVSSTSAATPQIALAANGGFSSVSGTAWLRTQASADHLCVLQSSTGEVAGTITYADLTN